VAWTLPPLGGMNTLATIKPLPEAPRPVGYHGAVSDFKRCLIEATLHQVRGNRTHAARALGLQRTYLLRLIRELGVAAPPPPPRRRAAGFGAG
jgi:DNA-binding NtrC family response regulator